LVNLVTQACAGLGHAHDAGVVHRDIKPENVVVVSRKDDEGNVSELVKVCDFGIAHWVPNEQKSAPRDEDVTLFRLPNAEQVVGTPAYMAPEQIRNEPVDARTDVYALGVLLYELSTGQLPFVSERPIDVLLLHVTQVPVPPSHITTAFDPLLESLILRALEKDPAQRFPDVRALRTALRELVDDDWVAATGQFRRIPTRSLPSPADFAANIADSLAIVATADDKSRRPALQALSDALRASLYDGNLRVARELLSWLLQRFADPGLRLEEREAIDRALRVLRDPAPAGAFATQLLSGKLSGEDAVPILNVAGPVAARALLEARRMQPPSLEMRARFVSFLRATGQMSLPVIVGSLGPLVGLTSRTEEALAEDLLRAAPDVRSDEGGELAVRFVRLDKPALAVVAIDAVARFWGPRAQALLLGVLDSTSDPARIAAVETITRLRAVDDWAIERLARIIVDHMHASLELRVAAANALAFATQDSRPRVAAFLQERLLPSSTLVGSLLNKAFRPKEDRSLLVALARSLFHLDRSAAKHVSDRLMAARPELRGELEVILSGR
jgi:serine/threonine-protein kinase